MENLNDSRSPGKGLSSPDLSEFNIQDNRTRDCRKEFNIQDNRTRDCRKEFNIQDNRTRDCRKMTRSHNWASS